MEVLRIHRVNKRKTMSAIEGEPCKRTRKVVKGEKMYIFQGKDWIDSSCPYENRVESAPLR